MLRSITAHRTPVCSYVHDSFRSHTARVIHLDSHINGFARLYWYWYILLTAVGLSPGVRSTVHIYTQTINRTIQNKQYTEQHKNWKSAGRAPSWLVIPWHLPYNRGKSTGDNPIAVNKYININKDVRTHLYVLIYCVVVTPSLTHIKYQQIHVKRPIHSIKKYILSVCLTFWVILRTIAGPSGRAV